MCDLESDGLCPVWDEVHRRARKPHECTACGETIPAGVTYRRTATLYDGHWETFKHCARCEAMVDAIKATLVRQGNGAYFTTETLHLNCGESWRSAFGFDAPPEIEALAFMLPGEVPNG